MKTFTKLSGSVEFTAGVPLVEFDALPLTLPDAIPIALGTRASAPASNTNSTDSPYVLECMSSALALFVAPLSFMYGLYRFSRRADE